VKKVAQRVELESLLAAWKVDSLDGKKVERKAARSVDYSVVTWVAQKELRKAVSSVAPTDVM